MLKNYNEFEKLKDNRFYFLSLKHFEDGLDPNCLVDNHCYLMSFFNDGSKNYDKKTHILTFALGNAIRDNDQQFFDFIKKTILELVKENKIEKNYIKQMAFSSINFNYKNDMLAIQFFIEHKFIDINARTDNSYTLLMLTNNKEKIKYLVNLGCNINDKLDKEDSPFDGLNVYEIAVKMKNKGLTKIFQPYLSSEQLSNNIAFRVREIREEKNIKNQLKLFRNAIIENNMDIINDIVNDQLHYKNLIEYDDKQNVNLINIAIRTGQEHILEKLIQFDYYQKNKRKLSTHGACHTEIALYSKKSNLAKILYENGFKDENSLIKKFEVNYINSSMIVDKLVDDGFKLSPQVLMNNYVQNAAKHIQYSKEELNHFFDKHSYLLHLENMKIYPQRHVIVYTSNKYGYQNTYHYEFKNKSINVLSCLLKKQEILDPISFDKNFNKLVVGIGFHEEKIGLKYSSLLLHHFIDREKEILGKLSYFGLKPWFIEMNKNNLEKLLLTYEDKEEKPAKKMKI